MSGRADGRRRRMAGRPDGVPLGRAFLIGPGLANEPLREAVDIVARVHGDGELPPIPVVWDSFLEVRARFVIRDGLPSAIVAKPGVVGLNIGLIHEIGHYLDFCGIDRFGAFASIASPRMDRWTTAVAASHTYRALLAAIDEGFDRISLADRARRRQLVDLQTPEELWARSYTQYVVSRSGERTLAEALARDRVRTITAVEFPLHWNDDEFGPIDEAIERLFRRLGWRRS